MAFIGIIADNKCEMQLKQILESKLNSPNKEHTIITINANNIENLKSIRFETILVMDLSIIEQKEKLANVIFSNLKYLVLNMDINSVVEFASNAKINVITFGFNSKSTITASSVEDDFMLCLQREIVNINQEKIEPQEIEVIISNKKLSKSSHNVMGIASIILIYGKNVKKYIKI